MGTARPAATPAEAAPSRPPLVTCRPHLQTQLRPETSTDRLRTQEAFHGPSRPSASSPAPLLDNSQDTSAKCAQRKTPPGCLRVPSVPPEAPSRSALAAPPPLESHTLTDRGRWGNGQGRPARAVTPQESPGPGLCQRGACGSEGPGGPHAHHAPRGRGSSVFSNGDSRGSGPREDCLGGSCEGSCCYHESHLVSGTALRGGPDCLPVLTPPRPGCREVMGCGQRG